MFMNPDIYDWDSQCLVRNFCFHIEKYNKLNFREVKKMIELGTINMEEDIFVVTDPCYEIGTWCQGIVNNVKHGIWKGYINEVDEGSWGIRVSELIVLHDSVKLNYTHSNICYMTWKEMDFDIGVDSGQMSIIPIDSFVNKTTVVNITEKITMNDIEKLKDSKLTEEEYDKCCEITLSDKQAGLYEEINGFVSSSGFDDGSYTCCYILEDEDKKVIGIKVEFINEHDDDDEEYEEEDYED